MMIQGFYTGISGIRTYQTAIDITADNLANISTTGFRANTAEFANLFERTLNTVHNRESVGVGSRLEATSSSQDIGSMLLTDRSTDIALQDEGWFGITGTESKTLYTRAGNFSFDVNNDLTTPDGYHVLGTMANNFTGETLTSRVAEVVLGDVDAQVPLTFPKFLYYPAEPTSVAKMIGNIGTIDANEIIEEEIDNTISVSITEDDTIDATEELNANQTVTGKVINNDVQNGDTLTLTLNGTQYATTVDADGLWSINLPTTDLQNSSNIDLSIDISQSDGSTYTLEDQHSISFGEIEPPASEIRTIGAGLVDPNGDRNHLNIEFSKREVQVPPGSQWDAVATVKSLDGTVIYDTINGIVEFNPDGSLKTSPFTTINNNGTSVEIDLGSGYDGIVSLSNVEQTSSSIADGTIDGTLRGYEINPNGEVIATFTNGMQSSMGQIAVYHFQNDQGLDRITGTRFSASSNSGEPIFYQDKDGKNITGTSLLNYHLENSNVKMEVGLTELIIFQRAFDANSKSITTADQMMQKALQMDA